MSQQSGANWDKNCKTGQIIVDTYFVKIVAINAVKVAHVSVPLRLESSADKERSQVKAEGLVFSSQTHITKTI